MKKATGEAGYYPQCHNFWTNVCPRKRGQKINCKDCSYQSHKILTKEDILRHLQGRALRDGNSAFIDRNWNAYPEQWAVFQSKPKLSKEFLEIKLSEWTSAVDFLEDPETEGEEREKPWKGNSGLSVADVEGNVSLTLSNGIYVDSLNLKPRIQNKIRRLAAFGNPVYYRNNAIGTSNFDTPRWIYLGKDHLNGYIQIPRGLYDILTKNLSAAGILRIDRSVERGIGKVSAH